MIKNRTDRNRGLAVIGELGPVAAYRAVEIDLTPVREDVHAECDGGLRAGEDRYKRVTFPRAPPLSVRRATPEIDDDSAFVENTDARAEFSLLREVPLKRRLDASETLVRTAGDWEFEHSER
jgi:hypothetical protein